MLMQLDFSNARMAQRSNGKGPRNYRCEFNNCNDGKEKREIQQEHATLSRDVPERVLDDVKRREGKRRNEQLGTWA